MENLEEVLQALDEFQKMRPTEIPRELEDYLCWVAKTGDPVYQWSMIKTLFREKLTRVMTDFYESCPTLELAPCPNVEHFNYDTMKSNLLERLESFANAPFTVQRICELLTAPRKEYNRVDKFMRAIEKNILVVSTREPGPIARRGETGDGMVNGSMDEDTTASVTQQQQPPPLPPPQSSQPQTQSSQPTQLAQSAQSQDVEMEYWEKDSTPTVNVHTIANESSSLPTTTLAKNIFAVDETIQEKLERVTSRERTDIISSNFISTVSDFSTIPNLSSQMQSHEPVQSVPVVSIVQNPSTPVGLASDSPIESAGEDTSPQSSLDVINGKNETVIASITTTTTAVTTTTISTPISMSSASTSSIPTITTMTSIVTSTIDSMRKLQTIIPAENFKSDDDSSSELYSERCNDKSAVVSTIVENTDEGVIHSMKNEEMTKSNSKCINTKETSSRSESMLTEDLLNTDVEMKSDVLANNAESIIEEKISNKLEEDETPILENIDRESLCSKNCENTKTAVFIESQAIEKDNAYDKCANAVIVSSSEATSLHQLEKTEMAVSSKEENSIDKQLIDQSTDSTELMDKILQPIHRATSSKSDDNKQTIQNPEFNANSFKTAEISNNKASLVESMISTSITDIENSKETATIIEKLDSLSSTVEMAGNSNNLISNVTIEHDCTRDVQQDDKTTTVCNIKGNESSVIESIVSKAEDESMELMEVDEEEPISTFQQMEEETIIKEKSWES